MGKLAIRTHTSSLKKMASCATVDNCVIVRMGWGNNFGRGIGHIVHNIVASTITVSSYSMVSVYGRSLWSFGLAASHLVRFGGFFLMAFRWPFA